MKFNYNLYKKIINMTDKEIIKYIINQCKRHKLKFNTDEINFIHIQNNSKLCLVAHVDRIELFDLPIKLRKIKDRIFNPIGNFGADDRSGIYILSMLIKNKMNHFDMLITNGEEMGGIGIKYFLLNEENVKKIMHYNLFIGLDRHGDNEYVTYHEIPKDLKNILRTIGLKKKTGSYSDVYDITEKTDIAHINLAIGYSNEHTQYEMQSISVLENIFDTLYQIKRYTTRQFKAKKKKLKIKYI